MDRVPIVAAMAIIVTGCLAPGGDLAAPQLGAFTSPVAVSKDAPASEPVIAALSDGTLFVEGVGSMRLPSGGTTNVNKIFRSTDGGASWSDVTPPFHGQERSNDGFVATGNGDRVYGANVFSLTFQLFRSDDKGGTWKPLDVPPLPALMHRHWIVPRGERTVHVAVEALPAGYAPYLAGQRPPSDAVPTPNEGLWYMRSDDLGESWSTPIQIDPTVNFAGQSNLVVSDDGQDLYVQRFVEKDAPRYVPTYTKGEWYLLASHDGGRTWRSTPMFPLTSELAAAIPVLALDADGTLYSVWSQEVGGSSRLHYSFTRDEGATWAAPRVVPGLSGTHAMPFALSRGNGTLAIMWYAADVEGRASKVNASWHVDHARMTDAAGEAPAVATLRATTEPIHQGNICAKGPACGPGEDRRLLDYPWMTLGSDGRAHLVFASTRWERPSAFAVVVSERR